MCRWVLLVTHCQLYCCETGSAYCRCCRGAVEAGRAVLRAVVAVLARGVGKRAADALELPNIRSNAFAVTLSKVQSFTCDSRNLVVTREA